MANICETTSLIKQAVREALAEHAQTAEPGPLLDRAGVGRLIGASLPKVDAMVAAGMPCLRSGGQLRFERAAVLQWLRDGHGAGVVTVRGGGQ